MLLCHAAPILEAKRSRYNLMLLLLCDHGVVGLAFIVFRLFVMTSIFGFFMENHFKSVSYSFGLFVSALIAYSLTNGGYEAHFLAMICGLFAGLQRHKKIIDVKKL